MRSFSLALGLLTVVLVSACGSSDTKRRKDDAEAGAGDSGSGGTSAGGRPAAGGASTGGAATGGTSAGGSNTGGAPEAGAGGAAPDGAADAAPEAEASVPELRCPDGGAPGPDGGDAGGYWRDFAAGVCRVCPAATLTCEDLLASPGPVYDPATRRLTVKVTPGVTEVVTAEFGVNSRFDGDGGTYFESSSVPASVDRNTLTVELSSAFNEATNFFRGWFTVTDACGQTVDTNDDPGATELQVVLTPLDGGATAVTTECYATD
jgi:hypothetical protein